MKEPRQVAVEALAVLDQRVEAAWESTFTNAPVSVKVAAAIGRGDPCEIWGMTDDELRRVIQLAMIGHTYMCRQKMLGGVE